MKILWLINIVTPIVGSELKIKSSELGGWILGALDGIKNKGNISVATVSNEVKEIKECKINNVSYIVFPQLEQKQLEHEFKRLLRFNCFDVIHIFGTEYYWSNAMINVAPREKIVINIQGLTNYIYVHLLEGVPQKYIYGNITLKIISKLSNRFEKPYSYSLNDMKEKRINEKETILKCNNFIGRTTWDEACVSQINSNINYYYINEILRNSFYTNKKWNPNKCERYSVFMSQANYSIKGLHYLLKAIKIVKKYYPHVKLYIGGFNGVQKRNSKIKLLKDKYFGGYFGYINTLLHDYGLYDNVELLGVLDEKQMVERYLKANVFVCSSTIENSPNSVGEAMMLGTPVIASYVGGIPDLLENNKEGLLYQCPAYYMLADCIMRIFADDKLALKLSKNAIKRSHKTHNKKNNTEALLKVYEDIIIKFQINK